jgi:hypothetical protein
MMRLSKPSLPLAPKSQTLDCDDSGQPNGHYSKAGEVDVIWLFPNAQYIIVER